MNYDQVSDNYDINSSIVKDVALVLWRSVNENRILNENFETRLESTIESNVKNTGNKQTELVVMSSQIAKGKNEDEIYDIERRFKNDLLKNKDIIEKIVDLNNERTTLITSQCNIRSILDDNFSQPIESGLYDTKERCCPSFWKPLKDIIYYFRSVKSRKNHRSF